jgi:hypothetical protein
MLNKNSIKVNKKFGLKYNKKKKIRASQKFDIPGNISQPAVNVVVPSFFR